MKILYVGKFINPWSTEKYVSHALRQCGATVVERQFTCTLNLENLTAQIAKHKPDVLLFSKVASECYPAIIDQCRKSGILTVCWLWDLYWGYRPHRPPQFYSDLLFTTDGGHVNLWQEAKTNHRVLRQGIHEPEHIIYPSEPEKDLAFIGNIRSYTQRRSLTGWLESHYRHRTVWHTRTRGLDLNKALAKVKIIVGDSYPTPNYWSNRVYEIIGRGGFLLFPETPGLDAEFTSGIHYVSYPRDDRNKLAKLIEHYVSHNEEREQIRQSGFAKCLDYTYTSRARELLRQIDEWFAGNGRRALMPVA